MSFQVAYDHSIFSIQTCGGISRYFVELAEHLSVEPDVRTRIVAPVHVCRMLRQHPSLPQTAFYIPKMRKTYRLLQFLNNSLSGPLLKRLQPDIIHATYYLARYRMPESCKKVITVFDMIHEKFADRMDAFEKTVPEIKKRVVADADHVICISEQTRRDLIEILGVEEKKTSVIHLAPSLAVTGSPQPSEGDIPYFLYVGSRQWPKNFDQLVKAFASLLEVQRDIALVCFGGGRFTPEEMEDFRSHGVTGKHIRFVSGNDLQLQRLYSNALALIYPSLYEGFGLPLLEAMSCGCPVLCSNTSSMPEVAGNAALYFTPTAVDEMTQAMEQIVESVEMREALIARGRERARLFSWEKCARETAEVYRSCLGRK